MNQHPVDRINLEETNIQVVHVHGTYQHYDISNLKGEISRVAQPAAESPFSMANLLDGIFMHRSPLVIGYSGWEGDVIMTNEYGDAGEAASVVDPMTSNGVTAALRHAVEAAALILKFLARGELPLRARKAYSCRILQTAKFFNEGIEKIIYEPMVRNRIGRPVAGAVYTRPAWSMNVVYARMHPDGMLSTFLLGAMLGVFRISASILYRCCRMLKLPR